jgi:DNA-directed RNA polymerase subunit K/omega
MMNESTKALAIQAGLIRGDFLIASMRSLEDFANLVAAAARAEEREMCAKTVLNIANLDAGNPYKQALRVGAEAIRSRSDEASKEQQ